MLGGGVSVHAKGSSRAGGPLPALNVHTCDISRQHLSCPQALQELVCACVPLAECGSTGVAKSSHSGFPGLSDIRTLGKLAGWMVGLWGGGW